MIGKNLRLEIRIPAEKLPEDYQNFKVLLPHGEEREVQTTDASLHGFGFLSNGKKEDFVEGARIVLKPGGKNLELYGLIIHSAEISTEWVRVGIRIQPTASLEKYQKVIRSVLDS